MAFLHAVHSFLAHSPAGIGLTTGLGAAMWTDLLAFRRWKSWHDVARYSWSTATFRWAQGASVGLLTGLGLGQM